MLSPVHFSSMRLDWQTPKALYDQLNAEFNFDCDPCLVTEGTIHDRDMLGSSWGKRNFVNPPYGRVLPLWIKKAFEVARGGALVVLLIPSRTDTSYFHDYILRAHNEGWAEIRFIRGRLHFDEHVNAAPFPSVVVVFNKKEDEVC